MTIIEMEYFRQVCRYGSFTKAAEELHITQPTISITMKNLENECGVPLFIRERNKVQLTDEGRILLEEVEVLLKQYEHLKYVVDVLNLNRNYVRIGLSTLNGNLVYPTILGEFRRVHPEIQVFSVEMSSQEQFEMLDKGELDLILTTYTFADQGMADIHPSHLYKRLPLMDTSTCFCVSSQHPLADELSVTLEQISAEPLILLSDHFAQTRRIRKLLADHHLPCNVIHQTNQMYTIERFVEQNVAAGFLPMSVAINNPDISAIPFTDESRPVELFWRKDRHMFSATKEFINVASSLFSYYSG